MGGERVYAIIKGENIQEWLDEQRGNLDQYSMMEEVREKVVVAGVHTYKNFTWVHVTMLYAGYCH